MKVSLVFLVICASFCYIKVESLKGHSNLEQKNVGVFKEVATFTREIAEQSKAESRDFNNLAVIRLENKENELYDEIIEELSSDNVLILPPYAKNVLVHTVSVSSMVVIVLDPKHPAGPFDKFAHILTFYESHFKSSTRVVFIAHELNRENLQGIHEMFEFLGVHNYILIHYQTSWKVDRYNRFTREADSTPMKDLHGNIKELFADKLKDLQGFSYRLILMREAGEIIITDDGHVSGIGLELFLAIVKHQNASIKIIEKMYELEKAKRLEFFNAFYQHSVDLTLNTLFRHKIPMNYRREVLTYVQYEYCALVPIPSRLSFLNFILTPFDASSWLMMTFTIAACTAVWKILRSKDSAVRFTLGLVANFLGQSIPFRENRRIQVTLLQLCILMTFIMGNAYQSLIISFMSLSREGIRLKTFEELYMSNIPLKVELEFKWLVANSGEYPSAVERMEVMGSVKELQDLLSQQSVALVIDCYSAERFLNVLELGGFYMLPDKTMPNLKKFLLAMQSPFYDKLQLFYNYIFESGIRQHWEIFFEEKKSAKMKRDQEFLDNEEYLLKMNDVHGIFYILAAGLGISLMVFLLEIFFWDFLKNLNFKKGFRKLNRACRFKTRTRRIIHVRPFRNRVQPQPQDY